MRAGLGVPVNSEVPAQLRCATRMDGWMDGEHLLLSPDPPTALLYPLHVLGSFPA